MPSFVRVCVLNDMDLLIDLIIVVDTHTDDGGGGDSGGGRGRCGDQADLLVCLHVVQAWYVQILAFIGMVMVPDQHQYTPTYKQTHQAASPPSAGAATTAPPPPPPDPPPPNPSTTRGSCSRAPAPSGAAAPRSSSPSPTCCSPRRRRRWPLWADSRRGGRRCPLGR